MEIEVQEAEVVIDKEEVVVVVDQGSELTTLNLENPHYQLRLPQWAYQISLRSSGKV